MRKVIVDSMSSLSTGDLREEGVEFVSVPLTLIKDGEEIRDDKCPNVSQVMDEINANKNVDVTTSCPSPELFLEAIGDADEAIIITASSKLSGSYNSAIATGTIVENKKIAVIDSLSLMGGEELIARKALRLLKSARSFEEIVKELEEFKSRCRILFVINKYDNLIKTGRVSKLVGSIASVLQIKPLCTGKEGQIHVLEKVRTIEGVFKRMIVNIKRLCLDPGKTICVITHSQAYEKALELKALVQKSFSFLDIVIRENLLVGSYYSQTGAITLSFAN